MTPVGRRDPGRPARALRPGLVADARRKGVGYVPRDRHRRGIVPQLSLAENLTLTIIERLGPAGLVRPAERDREAGRLVRSLEIVAASTEQPIAELSGGNQQKAVMGRALASEPKVLVVAHPTQGVDIASKEALFGILEQARAAGTARADRLRRSRRAGRLRPGAGDLPGPAGGRVRRRLAGPRPGRGDRGSGTWRLKRGTSRRPRPASARTSRRRASDVPLPRAHPPAGDRARDRCRRADQRRLPDHRTTFSTFSSSRPSCRCW